MNGELYIIQLNKNGMLHKGAFRDRNMVIFYNLLKVLTTKRELLLKGEMSWVNDTTITIINMVSTEEEL